MLFYGKVVPPCFSLNIFKLKVENRCFEYKYSTGPYTVFGMHII